MHHPVDLQFVRMLSCESAAAATLQRIGVFEARHRQVERWKVRMEPPAVRYAEGGYGVRVQADLDDGAVVTIRAHGLDLVSAVHEAFAGMEQAIVAC